MIICEPFGMSGPAGISDALQKVDCLAAQATTVSFGRLFGENGSLQTALTILLTLYIGLLAVNLLTGRSALRVSVLTPRMLTLGLVLTFVTSWIAYQSVVWNLAIGAPDEIAGVLAGTEGSATILFAQRLDMLFDAIAGAAETATAAAAANPANAAASSTFASPASILTFAALLLLLGTVGVLVVCRLALAALLILGPVFIVMALFEGTRGLFEGWLKSVAMFALVPLLTVLIGSGAVVAISPMVAGLTMAGGDIPLRAAVSILVASVVYVALMLVVLKVAGSLTRGWRIGKAANHLPHGESGNPAQLAGNARAGTQSDNPPMTILSDRVRTAVASLESRVSTNRLTHVAGAPIPAGHGRTETRELISGMSQKKHGSYFDHRTQPIASEIPREVIR